MELDELHVRHPRAGVPRQAHAVAGGNRRIGGVAEHLAGAAGGQQHGARAHVTHDRRRAGVRHEAGADADAVLDDQLNGLRVIEDLEPAGRAGLDPQGAAQLAAGRVGGVQHAANRVRRFAGERDLAAARRGRSARPSPPARARSGDLRRPARGPRRPRTARRRRPWCRRSAGRDDRRGPRPRRCRPARSRCCSPSGRPS